MGMNSTRSRHVAAHVPPPFPATDPYKISKPRIRKATFQYSGNLGDDQPTDTSRVSVGHPSTRNQTKQMFADAQKRVREQLKNAATEGTLTAGEFEAASMNSLRKGGSLSKWEKLR